MIDNHRNKRPEFQYPPESQGYRPTEETTWWGVLFGMFCWGVVIVALTALMLPVVAHVLHWALGGPHG